MTPVKTAQENVRWGVKVFPWASNFPSHDKNKMLDELEPIDIRAGILSLQLHRSKENPYGVCDFNFFGPLPSILFIGNWVLVKSYNGANDQEEGVVRFFGQIYNTKTSYQVNPSTGGLTQYTMVSIREWSFLYSVPVRYDSYAPMNLVGGAFLRYVAQAESLSKGDTKKFLPSDVAKITVDPFLFCAMALNWIGALSADGEKRIRENSNYATSFGSADIKGLKMPDVALLLPKVPRKLLAELGVPAEEQESPFEGNFVAQFFGILNGDVSGQEPREDEKEFMDAPFNSKRGVFRQGALDTQIVEAQNRPSYSNIIPVFVQGQSVWDLLTQNCDQFVNEVYTDIHYYMDTNGKVISRPMIVFRDKPFILQSAKTAEKDLIANWSSYDYLPRIEVPFETIERIDIDHGFTHSPNYLRVQCLPEGAISSKSQQVLAEITSTLRLPSEMQRYGGQTSYIQTPYVSTKEEVSAKWWQDVSKMQVHWESHRYRMPDVQLIIRDTNICFSVGNNVKFKVGIHTFVGHLKNLSITYSRNSEATHRTTTVLSLERLVMEVPTNTKELTYIPEALILNIFDQNAKVVPIDPSEDIENLFAPLEKKTNPKKSTE